MRSTTRWAARLAMIVGMVVGVGGCTLAPPAGDAPLRYRDELPGKTVSVTPGITYSTSQDGTANDLKLDVYRPIPDTLTLRPAVIVVHGGSFRVGGRGASNVVTLADGFAKRGYVAASIDYRLLGPPTGNCGHPGVDPVICVQAALAAQHDAQAAIRFLRANAATYGIDPTRIAITGTSAGAGTALLVAVNEEDPGNSGNAGEPSTVRAAMPISGAVPPAFNDQFEAVLDPGDAGVLFFYGTQDHVVPPAWVQANALSLNRLGNTAIIEAVDGGHTPFTAADQLLYLTQSSYWMYYLMDLAHAQGQPPAPARSQR